MLQQAIVPQWPAPARVCALQTSRHGGTSLSPYDSLNLGTHVGDAAACVAANRQLLQAVLPGKPLWLQQVHGTVVVEAEQGGQPNADASIAREAGVVCAVLTADCLPLLLCDDAGSVVGAVHAGWRGLAAGVIEAAVHAMEVAPTEVMAWLGPAIGPQAFEVGENVRAAFLQHDRAADSAFVPRADKYLADLYLLARQRLEELGIKRIYGGEFCTYTDSGRFYSYRRDGQTGRMASMIWLSDPV